MAQPSAGGLFVIERILRERDGVWRQIADERDLGPLVRQMLASSAISLAIYGAVLGASYGWLQALSSLIKLPLLFLATLAICLPTLYLFNLVFGARLSLVQAISVIMVSITVTAVLTLAFAPIALFFLITAQSYSFYKVLNVGILLLTAIVGLRFLTIGMRALNAFRADAGAADDAVAYEVPAQTAGAPESAADGDDAASVPVEPVYAAQAVHSGAAVHPGMVAPVGTRGPGGYAVPGGHAVPGNGAPWPAVQPHPPAAPAAQRPPASMALLYIWILLFGFVGTQLAWTLRPFFGSPGEPFGVFRHIGGTFYADVLVTIGHLLGG